MTTTNTLVIRKTVTVGVDQQFAFTFFTENITQWWNPDHHIGEADLAEAIVEPKVGGRFYERGVDGSECDWGRVLVWEPPSRLVLAWQLNGDWVYDPGFVTEVEVRFIAESSTRTLVDLEHRNLERFGEKAEQIMASFGSANGWQGLLGSYAAGIESKKGA